MRFTIRRCRTIQEFSACTQLQREIWGYSESEAYPTRMFVNLTQAGGHLLGAFLAGCEIVGFAAAMPAWHGRQRYYHSLSLGVKAGFENQGLGRKLKIAQRQLALKQGINLIEWTFDPLRAKNAFFNIERLGAIARKYIPDYYGPVRSRLQLGLPSDRLIAEWHLKSPRVLRALRGGPVRNPGRRAVATVEIPVDLEDLVARDRKIAIAWQSRVRLELKRHFLRGLTITGLERGKVASRYLLEKS